MIDFTNPQRFGVTATFDASQFDNIQISDAVAFDGSAGGNHVVVFGSLINGNNWSFTNWGLSDTVTLNGTVTNDTIYGSIANEVINGDLGDDRFYANGRDSVFGGDGNDSLHIGHGLADGGPGVDAIFVVPIDGVALTIDISNGGGGRDIGQGLTLVSIEQLNLVGSNLGDSLAGGKYVDVLFGDDGADIVLGRGGDDVLSGDNGNDEVYGGTGADLIWGGAGTDFMVGGSGADRFLFSPMDDLNLSAARDVIRDFQQGSDLIDLYMIDPVPNATSVFNDAFVFVGQTAFADYLFSGPQMRYYQTTMDTIVQLRVGDRFEPVFEVKLHGLVTLTASDFIL